MSLLSVCQNVADMIGVTRPTAILTGLDQQSRQFLGYAKETLTELSLMDWPVLEVPYSFATVASQTQYDLPADFQAEVGDTVYSSSRYYQTRGSLSPADWARQRNNLPAAGCYKFRIFGNPLKINISPTPTGVETMVLEYRTSNRVRQLDSSLKATYFSDDDVSLVPEDLVEKGLKWRVLRRKGMDYSEEFNDYELSRAQRVAQSLGSGSIPVAVRSTGDYLLPDGYVPESGFG